MENRRVYNYTLWHGLLHKNVKNSGNTFTFLCKFPGFYIVIWSLTQKREKWVFHIFVWISRLIYSDLDFYTKMGSRQKVSKNAKFHILYSNLESYTKTWKTHFYIKKCITFYIHTLTHKDTRKTCQLIQL